jgi:hypothetical protein
VQFPAPPANLAAPCPPLALPPTPLLDPERAVWEADMIAKYGDCGARHVNTIEAWKRAANRSNQ